MEPKTKKIFTWLLFGVIVVGTFWGLAQKGGLKLFKSQLIIPNGATVSMAVDDSASLGLNNHGGSVKRLTYNDGTFTVVIDPGIGKDRSKFDAPIMSVNNPDNSEVNGVLTITGGLEPAGVLTFQFSASELQGNKVIIMGSFPSLNQLDCYDIKVVINITVSGGTEEAKGSIMTILKTNPTPSKTDAPNKPFKYRLTKPSGTYDFTVTPRYAADPDYGNDHMLDGLGAGTLAPNQQYTVTQTEAAAGYQFDIANCTSNKRNAFTSGNPVQVTIQPGEDVVCIFVNKATVTGGESAPQFLTFTAPSGAVERGNPFTLSSSLSVDIKKLNIFLSQVKSGTTADPDWDKRIQNFIVQSATIDGASLTVTKKTLDDGTVYFEITVPDSLQSNKNKTLVVTIQVNENVTNATAGGGSASPTAGGHLETAQNRPITFTDEPGGGGGTTPPPPPPPAEPVPPELTVVKDAVSDSPGEFTFNVVGGDLNDNPKLIDDQTGKNSKTYKDLKPGQYTITETIPAPGYSAQPSIQCSINFQTQGTNGARLNLGAGQKVTCTFTNNQEIPPNARRLFVSHKTYAGGEINGIPGGNVLCNALAKEGELGSEGKWAFLGSAEAEEGKPAQNAKDVLKDGVTYVRINRNRWVPKDSKDNDDGLITLGTKQDLLTKGPERPVLRTPFGPQQQDRGLPYLYHQGNDGYPYTGSDGSGTVIPGNHCKSWTSSDTADAGRKGHAHATGDWIDETDEGGCDQKKPIYCVETDEPVVTASTQVTVNNPSPTNPIPVGGGGLLPSAFNPLTPTHIIPPNPVNGNVNVNVNGLTGIPSGKPPLPNGATSVSTFEVKSTQNLANGGLVTFRIAIPEGVAKAAMQKYYGYGSFSVGDFWASKDLATKLYAALKLYRFNENTKEWEGCPGFAHVGFPNIFEIGCKGTSIFTFAEEQPPAAPAAQQTETTPPPVQTSTGGGSGGGGGGYAQTIESVISGAWTPPAPKAEESATPEPNQPEFVEPQKTAAPKIVFSDVSAKSKYKTAIEKVASLGIMIGSPDPKDQKKRVFKEKNVVNRAELTTLLVRWLFPGMHGAPTERSACFFKDIAKSAWFSETVFVGCEQGLVKGYSDKSFKPTAAMNYVEATKVIVEAAARKSPKGVGAVLLKELAAGKKTNEAWFEPYVRTAEKTKILSKDDLALVKKYPTGGATRGWVAQAIANIPEL